MDQEERIACASCGMTIVATKLFLDRRREDYKSFYCLNGHEQSYIRPKPKPPTIIEKEVEVIVEKDYEPKDFTEMLNMHEHEFTKKVKGQMSCKHCGLYEAAYQILKK